MRHFYFDHNAASPLAPDVLREFASALAEVPGNASSIHHFGQSARRKLETARRDLAALIGCDPRELVFTSGGTESDNLAILGFVERQWQYLLITVQGDKAGVAVIKPAGNTIGIAKRGPGKAISVPMPGS